MVLNHTIELIKPVDTSILDKSESELTHSHSSYCEQQDNYTQQCQIKEVKYIERVGTHHEQGII